MGETQRVVRESQKKAVCMTAEYSAQELRKSSMRITEILTNPSRSVLQKPPSVSSSRTWSNFKSHSLQSLMMNPYHLIIRNPYQDSASATASSPCAWDPCIQSMEVVQSSSSVRSGSSNNKSSSSAILIISNPFYQEIHLDHHLAAVPPPEVPSHWPA